MFYGTTDRKMAYLLRFTQLHETFRQPETEALADLLGFKIEWTYYSDDVRHFCCSSRRREGGSVGSKRTTVLATALPGEHANGFAGRRLVPISLSSFSFASPLRFFCHPLHAFAHNKNSLLSR